MFFNLLWNFRQKFCFKRIKSEWHKTDNREEFRPWVGVTLAKDWIEIKLSLDHPTCAIRENSIFGDSNYLFYLF